jgi:hypothetical protein
MSTPVREKPQLRTTRDYRMFDLSPENRNVSTGDHGKLKESMKQYGFLSAYPIHCRRVGARLVIVDGQHRYTFAVELGLPVWYVVSNDEVDVAQINNTQRVWHIRDYAESFVKRGKNEYAELLQFVDEYGLPVSISAAILFGTATFQHMKELFFAGEFKVKNRARAAFIASTYRRLTALSKEVRNARLLSAVYACSYLADFDLERLMDGAQRRRDKLVSYSTAEAYLDMIEDLYNFGRHTRVAVKIPAQNIMRTRNPAKRKQAA